MSMFRKFSSASKLLTKAQRYAQQNPEKVRKFTDKAARFADKQTKGRYRPQIDKAVRKADDLTGQGSQAGQQPGSPYPGQPGGSNQNPQERPSGSNQNPQERPSGSNQNSEERPSGPQPGGPHQGPRRD